MTPISSAPTPLEQMLRIGINRRNITIGLPAPAAGEDRRFPLTPEAAGLLVERGFTVKMQQGAASAIHYPDLKYQQQGVEITDRAETLRTDMVIYLSPLGGADVRGLKRGSMLLTLFPAVASDPDVVRILLAKGIITIALDRICDDRGNTPFADILAEIAGRAAMASASALLADSVHGKGILLGGIAGIVPCEATILGSGIDACAAAQSAIGLGATVRMFDNDVYRLRSALRQLGPGVAGSAIHPHVLINALRSADVIVATDIRPLHIIPADIVAEMKAGVITFDLTSGPRRVFPSMPAIDLGNASAADNSMDGRRACYINPANAVPRTVAMALSNTLLTMVSEIFTCDGMTNALMLNRGLQMAALTFLGKPVNTAIGNLVGLRAVDINLILQFS